MYYNKSRNIGNMIKKELLKSREDVLKSDAYWTTGIQIALYNCAVKFVEEKGN